MSVSVMKKLTVFAFQRDADALLRRLVKLRCVEVRQVDCSDEALKLRRMSADEALARADKSLSDIRAVLPELTKYSAESHGLGRSLRGYDPDQFRRDGSLQRAERTVEQAKALMARGEEIRGELQRLQMSEDALLPWMELDVPPDQMDTERTRTVAGIYPVSVKQALLEEAMDAVGAYMETVDADRFGVYATVTYLKSGEAAVLEALAGFGWAEAQIPEGTGLVRQRLEQIEAERVTLEGQAQDLEEAMRNLAESLESVEILHDLTDTDRTVALLHQRLAKTDTCAMIEGWIPSFAQDGVKEALAKYQCAYEMRDPLSDEDPPILLRNNGFAMNFEWVVGMYSYPKYGRFDPTMIMSIFYFLIFGMMFADVGYGLLLVIGGFGAARFLHLKTGMKRMLCMFGYCGISAILMGVIFGGWFGDLPTAVMQNLLGLSVDTEAGHFFGSGLWFNPLENPMEFLIVSLAMGGIHLIAGMAVKLYILCRDGKAAEGICTIVPYWVLFGGLLTLLIDQRIGLWISIAGGVMILLLNGYGIRNPFKRLFKGLGGLYGLINYASDLLSYSRILALGLVAAVIAKVINMITALGKSGVVGAIFMVIVLIAGHALNLAINVLGSFVHTSRLQYMEFFGKFYEDGGRPFDPALPTEEYSQAEDA